MWRYQKFCFLLPESAHLFYHLSISSQAWSPYLNQLISITSPELARPDPLAESPHLYQLSRSSQTWPPSWNTSPLPALQIFPDLTPNLNHLTSTTFMNLPDLTSKLNLVTSTSSSEHPSRLNSLPESAHLYWFWKKGYKQTGQLCERGHHMQE